MGGPIDVGFSFGLQWVSRCVGLRSEEASDGLGFGEGAIFDKLVSISEVELCT